MSNSKLRLAYSFYVMPGEKSNFKKWLADNKKTIDSEAPNGFKLLEIYQHLLGESGRCVAIVESDTADLIKLKEDLTKWSHNKKLRSFVNFDKPRMVRPLAQLY